MIKNVGLNFIYIVILFIKIKFFVLIKNKILNHSYQFWWIIKTHIIPLKSSCKEYMVKLLIF